MLNSAEVLALHTKLMKSYDAYWESTVFLASIDEGKLGKLKEFINQATTYEISALTNRNLNLPIEAIAKIEQAVFSAFIKARDSAKEARSLNEFKSEFRKTYDAALRIELYRQFISKVPRISDTSITVGEFISSVVKMMSADIKQFQSIASNFSEKDRNNFVKLKNEFNHYASEFRSACYYVQGATHMSDVAFDFEKKAGKLIRSFQIQYEHDLSWTPFLKNLLINLVLIATGVGALVSLGLLIYRGITGRHAFFDNPMLIKRPTIATEEKLLSPEDENPYSFFNQEDLAESRLVSANNNLLKVDG